MSELLAVVRKLRTALENPSYEPPFTIISLSDDDAEKIGHTLARHLDGDTTDGLPLGVETKLRGLLPVWKLLRYVTSTDEANGIRRRHVDTVREIEASLSAKGEGEPLKHLKPCHRKAYLAFRYAEQKTGKTMQIPDAYKWLQENGIDEKDDNVGELADYYPPKFAAFARYVGNARQRLDDRRNTPRKGRSFGKSVVKGDQIESPGDEDD